MHPAGKIIIGLILIIIGLGLFVDSVVPLSGVAGTTIGGIVINWFDNFIVVLTGAIPILLIIIGLFVVWLEADELKSRKELQQEVKTPEEPKPEKKGKK